MNKTLKHTLLLSIFVFAFILSPLAVIKLSVLKMLLSKVEWLIPLAVISIVFSFTLLKHRIAGITAILGTAFLIALITYVIKQLDDEYEEEIHWNDAQDEFTCKFIVGPQGRFYLKGAINNAPGLFLFDTGCSITSFNEKYISKTRLGFGKQTNKQTNKCRCQRYSAK